MSSRMRPSQVAETFRTLEAVPAREQASLSVGQGAAVVGYVETLEEEIRRLRWLLFRTALAVSDPDHDHVDRLVAISAIIGPADEWR